MHALFALLSFALHAALALAIVHATEQERRKTVTASISQPAHFMPKVDGEGTGERCEHRYVGIGVTHDVWNEIKIVGEGYPADRAGIMPGDVVRDWPMPDADGWLTLYVTRNGQSLTFRMRVEEICTREPQPPIRERPRGW